MNIIRGGLIVSYHNEVVDIVCIAALALYGIYKLVRIIINKKKENSNV